MYIIFQRCRHARIAEHYLKLRGETLKLAQCQGTLIVDVPDQLLDILNERDRTEMRVSLLQKGRLKHQISSNNKLLFSLLYVRVHQLQLLWRSESIYAVRSLGYAFHMIPNLLRTPERFDPNLYMNCFQIVCPYWDELSPEMRQTFCDALGMSLDKAKLLISTPNFPINVWGRTKPDTD